MVSIGISISYEALVQVFAVGMLDVSSSFVLAHCDSTLSFFYMQVDFSEFSRFYDFVFFMCRENGQKNISKFSHLIWFYRVKFS
jgi:DCN1-like protein 1/2